MNKAKMIYEGKAKKLYDIDGEKDLVWVEYKDDLTAFNAQKRGTFEGKGRINAKITVLIYQHLASHGIKTHLVSVPSDHELICRRLEIIPLEVVTRNRLAGSTAKKLGIDEGKPLSRPLIEFYLKDDKLGDPFISDDQALMLQVVKKQVELDELKEAALKINERLKQFFAVVGIELIDFKLEFGRDKTGTLLLGDEISPDTCRLWDSETQEKMDKDRFRRDLGDVQSTYESVLERISKRWAK